jgi:hypothetical protein
MDRWMAEREVTERNGATQHLAHVKAERRRMPPQGVLDRLADEKLNGGLTYVQRKRTCPTCSTVLPTGSPTCDWCG